MRKVFVRDGNLYFWRNFLSPREVQYLAVHESALIGSSIRETHPGRTAYIDHYVGHDNRAGSQNQQELEQALSRGKFPVTQRELIK